MPLHPSEHITFLNAAADRRLMFRVEEGMGMGTDGVLGENSETDMGTDGVSEENSETDMGLVSSEEDTTEGVSG